MNTPETLICHSDIVEAAERLDGKVRKTPLIESIHTSQFCNARVFLKAETLQHCGSFKFRGAYNFICQLSKEQKSQGVVAYSSGNHAQAVAKVANLNGISATIVMPEDAPEIKIKATKDFGAKIVLYDRNTESRETIAAEIVSSSGGTLVPPYDHPNTIAGQGTVGLEIIEQLAQQGCKPEIVMVPCSGGGLVAGIAIIIKHAFPKAKVYAVEPEGFDDTSRSLLSGKIKRIRENRKSICDALLVPSPGRITFPINKNLLSGGLTVTDQMVERAMASAFLHEKLVLEPGGAAALAAVFNHRQLITGKTTIAILSGGNVDPRTFKMAINKN